MEIFHRHRFLSFFIQGSDRSISPYISIYLHLSPYISIYLLSDGDVYDISATISLNPKTNTLFDLRLWSKYYIIHYMFIQKVTWNSKQLKFSCFKVLNLILNSYRNLCHVTLGPVLLALGINKLQIKYKHKQALFHWHLLCCIWPSTFDHIHASSINFGHLRM